MKTFTVAYILIVLVFADSFKELLKKYSIKFNLSLSAVSYTGTVLCTINFLI